jgi:mannose-6-phosphate isomerase-like protein (cupin superfamily)
MNSRGFDQMITVWAEYLDSIDDWQMLVKGVEPKRTGCGLIYELDNPIDRFDRPDQPGEPGESFAIADMRGLAVTEPHYHANGETEIYVVITGTGSVLLGKDLQKLEPGSIIITPPDTGHATFPEENLVLAAKYDIDLAAEFMKTMDQLDARIAAGE